MKLLGLTGGVGMGKSTAAGFFIGLGARVVDTDDLARQLVQPGQPALQEIIAEFGRDILQPDGQLNRPLLAQQVFADEARRARLEAILHPRIRASWSATVAAWRREGVPVAVVVIPLLFETRAEGQFDQILCVACSPETQRDRLRLRGWSDRQIGRRIAAQMPVAQKMARAHYVIWSEGTTEVHRRQLVEILNRP
jgi:dephospho-CoA kinase